MDQNETPVIENSPKGSRKGAVSLALVVCLAVALGILLFQFGPVVSLDREALMASDGVAQQDTAISSRVVELERRLKDVESKLESSAAQNASVPNNAGMASVTGNSNDIEALRASLAGLSSALSLLQTQIEKTAQASSETNENAKNGVATVLGFLQMERASHTGMPFEKERMALRTIAEGDGALADLLVKLEPYALSGVDTFSDLESLWQAKAHEATIAMRQASAKSWVDRLAVAVEGMVSIRSLYPKVGSSVSLATVATDIKKGNLTAAILVVDALPEASQKLLSDWKEKAQRKGEVLNLMDQIAAHLMARGRTIQSSQPQTEMAPQPMDGKP